MTISPTSATSISEHPVADLQVLSGKSVLAGAPDRTLVIRTSQDFIAIREKWDAFLQDCGVNNLTMSSAWILAWITNFKPEQLYITIVQDANGQWLAAAPFQIVKGRTGYSQKLLNHFQFIGTQPTIFDWMTIATHPDADRQAIIVELAKSIRKAKWDLLELFFNDDQEQLRTLLNELGHKENGENLKETMPIPWLALPSSMEEFHKTRRKKTRMDVTRLNNRMKKETGVNAELVYHQSSTPESKQDARNVLEEFAEGHQQYWGEKGVKSEFTRYPKLIDFYADMLLASEQHADDEYMSLRLTTLELAGQKLSFHLGFWQRNHYLSHLTHYEESFKNYSPGMMHMEALVVDTLNRGGEYFDFGRGDEPYKRLWTKEHRPLWNLRLFRNPLSRAIWEIDATLKRATGRVVF